MPESQKSSSAPANCESDTRCEWDETCEAFAVAAVSRSDSRSGANLSYACEFHLLAFINVWLADTEVYPIDIQRVGTRPAVDA